MYKQAFSEENRHQQFAESVIFAYFCIVALVLLQKTSPLSGSDASIYHLMFDGKKEPLSPDVTLFRCGRLLRWFMVLPGGT